MARQNPYENQKSKRELKWLAKEEEKKKKPHIAPKAKYMAAQNNAAAVRKEDRKQHRRLKKLEYREMREREKMEGVDGGESAMVPTSVDKTGGDGGGTRFEGNGGQIEKTEKHVAGNGATEDFAGDGNGGEVVHMGQNGEDDGDKLALRLKNDPLRTLV